MSVEVLESAVNVAVDAELKRLREQVGELQKRGTELVEENRRLRAARPDRRADVTAFHLTCGHAEDVRQSPAAPTEQQIRLRLGLIAEEFCELLDASLDDSHGLRSRLYSLIIEAIQQCNVVVDLPELADATIDIDYLTEGLRVCCGINGAPLWAAVQKANMAKLGGGKNANGKIVKPAGWTPPDIDGELRKQGWEGR